MPRSNNDEHPLHYVADGDRPEATLTHDAPLGAHRGLLLARDLNRTMRSRKLPLHGLADLARVAHSTVARVLNGDVLPDIGTSDTTGGGTRPSALARPRSDSRFGISQAPGDLTRQAPPRKAGGSQADTCNHLASTSAAERTNRASALTETNTNQPYTENRRSHPSQRPTPRTTPLRSAPIRYAVHVSGQVAQDVRPGNRREHQRTPIDQRACTPRLKIHSLGFLQGSLQAPAFVAQGIEHRSPKAGVAGSNPAGGTKVVLFEPSTPRTGVGR